MGRGMGRQTSGMSSGRRAWVDAVVGTSGEVCGEADGRRARARARPSGLARTEKMRGAGRDAERRGGADDEHPYAPRRGHHQPPRRPKHRELLDLLGGHLLRLSPPVLRLDGRAGRAARRPAQTARRRQPQTAPERLARRSRRRQHRAKGECSDDERRCRGGQLSDGAGSSPFF